MTPLPGEFLKKPDDPRLVAKATYKSRARSHVQIKAVEPVKNKTMEGAGAGVDMMREGTTGMPWSVKGKAPPIKKSKTASKSKRAKTTALADKSNAQTPKARSLKEVGSQKQKTSLPHSASFERRLSLVPSIRAEVATPSDIPPTTTVPKFIRPKKLHRARKLFVKKRPEGQEPDFQVFHDPLPDPEVVAPLPSEEHVSSAAPLDALPEPLAAEELQETIVDHEEESNEVQEAVDEPLENLMEPSIQTGEVEQSEDLEETTLSDAMDLFFDATSPKAVPKELYMQDEEIVILHEVMDEFNGGTIHLEPLLAEFSDPPDATVEPDPIAEKIIGINFQIYQSFHSRYSRIPCTCTRSITSPS